MELKTLKDFPRLKNVHPDSSWGLISRDDLRKEAIKWIKHFMEGSYYEGMDNEETNWNRKLPNGVYCNCDPESSCAYHNNGFSFMGFFNIIEDELKCVKEVENE